MRFRPLTAGDLPLLEAWLRAPHVARWWDPREADRVTEHYLPSIEGRDPTDLFVVELDARPVGFVQTYLVADYPEYAELIGVGEAAAGVDLLLGEPELTGRGIGTELLRRFVAEIVFARGTTMSCVADPDVRNAASLSAFQKAGFRRVGEFVDPDDGQTHALVRRDRG